VLFDRHGFQLDEIRRKDSGDELAITDRAGAIDPDCVPNRRASRTKPSRAANGRSCLSMPVQSALAARHCCGRPERLGPTGLGPKRSAHETRKFVIRRVLCEQSADRRDGDHQLGHRFPHPRVNIGALRGTASAIAGRRPQSFLHNSSLFRLSSLWTHVSGARFLCLL